MRRITSLQKNYNFIRQSLRCSIVHPFILIRLNHSSSHITVGNPDDIVSKAFEAVHKCNELHTLVHERGGVRTAKETLIIVDAVSNTLCSVIDMAEFIRNVHTDVHYRKKAEEAFSYLSSYLHELNSDNRVYMRLREILENQSIMKTLTTEEAILVKDLCREFEMEGIHLDEEIKDQANALRRDVDCHETAFMQNISSQDKLIQFGPISSPEEYESIKKWLSRYVNPQLFTSLPLNHLICPPNNQIVRILLKSLSEEEIRKQIWWQSQVEPSKNCSVLGNLIKSRQQLSRTIGYQSYAHKILAGKILNTPEAVMLFLKRLNDVIRPQASKEIQILKNWKRNNSNHSDGITSLRREDFLPPWDLGLAMQSFHSNNTSDEGARALSQISDYFPLNSVIAGLQMICKRLFAIDFVQASYFNKEEVWIQSAIAAVDANDQIDAKVLEKEGIFKFSVFEATGNNIGTMYLDLYRREHKFTGAAHFTLRCGCMHSSSRTAEVITRMQDENNLSNSAVLSMNNDYTRQLPIVSLVMNFENQKNGNTRLSFYETEVLYHEVKTYYVFKYLYKYFTESDKKEL